MKYTLNVRWAGERFEVTVPELGEEARAYGATQDEALENGQRLIIQAQIAKAARERRVNKTVA